MGSAASSIPAEELSKPLDASDVSTPRGETALAEVRRLRLLLLAEASSEGDEWKLVEELTCYCGAVKVTANGAPAIECFCHCVRLLHTTLAPLAACAAHDPHPDPRSPSLFASSQSSSPPEVLGPTHGAFSLPHSLCSLARHLRSTHTRRGRCTLLPTIHSQSDCRRWGGGACQAMRLYPAANVKVEGELVMKCADQPEAAKAWRKGCAKCGGVVYDDKSAAGMAMIPAGLSAKKFDPAFHLFCKDYMLAYDAHTSLLSFYLK